MGSKFDLDSQVSNDIVKLVAKELLRINGEGEVSVTDDGLYKFTNGGKSRVYALLKKPNGKLGLKRIPETDSDGLAHIIKLSKG